MEKFGTWDKKTVINELTQGKELANELKKQLYHLINSKEGCSFLLEKILSSYDNALSLINCMALLENQDTVTPNSIQGSPISEVFNSDSKDQIQKRPSKKRKTSPRWSEEVRVCSGLGADAHTNDAYNWRKYGQKDILGATHPRAYYRCTHRHTQGCLATKQVQKMDDDPSVYEIIYRGNHSCMQERLKKKEEKSERNNEQMITSLDQVKIQEFVSKEEINPSFSFPSTPIQSENMEAHFYPELLNFAKPNYSPQLLSPETSESYFTTQSPCPGNDFLLDFGETISNATAVMNFPVAAGADFDFFIDQQDIDSPLIDVSDYLCN